MQHRYSGQHTITAEPTIGFAPGVGPCHACMVIYHHPVSEFPCLSSFSTAVCDTPAVRSLWQYFCRRSACEKVSLPWKRDIADRSGFSAFQIGVLCQRLFARPSNPSYSSLLLDQIANKDPWMPQPVTCSACVTLQSSHRLLLQWLRSYAHHMSWHLVNRRMNTHYPASIHACIGVRREYMLVDLADQCFSVLSTDCDSIISHYCPVAFVQWHAVVGIDMFARLDWLDCSSSRCFMVTRSRLSSWGISRHPFPRHSYQCTLYTADGWGQQHIGRDPWGAHHDISGGSRVNMQYSNFWIIISLGLLDLLWFMLGSC